MFGWGISNLQRDTLESCVVQIRNRSQRNDYFDDDHHHQSMEVKYISTLRELANVDIKYSHMAWSLAIFVKINIYSVASMIERFQLFNEDRNETKSGQQIKNTKFSTSRKLIEANYNILDKYLLWIIIVMYGIYKFWFYVRPQRPWNELCCG